MADLIYKELGYKINGLIYEIDNVIGYGQSEKVYADAFEELLKRENIQYKRELYQPIKISGKLIAKRYFDFCVDGKIIIEFKAGNKDYRQACTQLFGYLKQGDYKLGLIARFTSNGVQIKRIPNLRK